MTQISIERDLDASELLSFLREIDPDTLPPLSSRVVLEDYATKLASHAVCVVARVGAEIVGFYGGYCNDFESRLGYLSLQAVVPSYRGTGLGERLLICMIDAARELGMCELLLETSAENKAARSLHEKHGFREVEDDRPATSGSIYMRLALSASEGDVNSPER